MILSYADFWRCSIRRLNLSRSASSVGQRRTLAAKGETIREAGWRAVYDSDIEEEDEDEQPENQVLPELKKGQSLPVKKLEVTEGKTKPPAHYTEQLFLPPWKRRAWNRCHKGGYY